MRTQAKFWLQSSLGNRKVTSLLEMVARRKTQVSPLLSSIEFQCMMLISHNLAPVWTIATLVLQTALVEQAWTLNSNARVFWGLGVHEPKARHIFLMNRVD